MYKLCKTAHTKQRSQHIAATLLRMMENKHFNDITISSLCEEVNVPRKSFYRYFDTKEDVFHLYIDTLLEECIRLSGMDARQEVEVTQERLSICYRFWLEHKSFLDAAKRSNMVPHILSRMLQYYEFSTSADHPTSSFSTYQIRTLFSMTGMFSMILQWYTNHFDRTPEEMAKLTLELFEKPLIDS